MGKKHFCFFQTAETGNRTPNSGVKGSGANHYPRAPAPIGVESTQAFANGLHFLFFKSSTKLKVVYKLPGLSPTPIFQLYSVRVNDDALFSTL